MSPRQPVVSGERLIKALGKGGLGSRPSTRQPRPFEEAGRKHALVVPLHRELRRGTLGGILRDADLSADDLRRLLD